MISVSIATTVAANQTIMTHHYLVRLALEIACPRQPRAIPRTSPATRRMPLTFSIGYDARVEDFATDKAVPAG